MFKYFYILIILIFYISCKSPEKVKKNIVTCTDESCKGLYIGPEFIYASDVAHQFSNKMSEYVGKKLKILYDQKKYSKVDFDHIVMSTEGMGSGNVVYEITIPFIRVKEMCESYTSFDHVGGWNHMPDLKNRKRTLNRLLIKGESLDVSKLIKTKEGLQEYWIQWKNIEKQSHCKDS